VWAEIRHDATVAAKLSAGLLLYRLTPGAGAEVMLVHMGGPFWARKDAGAWSIPKGECDEGEDPLAAARREFAEELGVAAPAGEAEDLGEVRQSGGKRVRAWAVRGDLDIGAISSKTFPLEWPPRSGSIREFPEVDRAGWFDPETAKAKLVKGQRPLVDALLARLAG
jgi:predicted NUDIX family NTP pyrophosphohydrolase